jgi:formylmethanofuran dehydrogenase subunit D
MTETFGLVPGRTTDQGCGISEGKFQDKYQKEIRALQVAPGDMTRLGLSDGDRARLTAEEGQTVEVCIVSARKDELPEGLLFIAYGDISSRLMVGVPACRPAKAWKSLRSLCRKPETGAGLSCLRFQI